MGWFCWHRWTKWSDRNTGTLTVRAFADPLAAQREIGVFVVQERRCEKCQALELRTQRARVD